MDLWDVSPTSAQRTLTSGLKCLKGAPALLDLCAVPLCQITFPMQYGVQMCHQKLSVHTVIKIIFRREMSEKSKILRELRGK